MFEKEMRMSTSAHYEARYEFVYTQNTIAGS